MKYSENNFINMFTNDEEMLESIDSFIYPMFEPKASFICLRAPWARVWRLQSQNGVAAWKASLRSTTSELEQTCDFERN